ncbi:MAG: DUF192 domain-containing protein [Nanoarchaeota archaeon]|nr:DUF192 domain-containing protein [Nanoarchaeota archaeon]
MKLENFSGKFPVECEIADSPWKQAVGLSFSRKRRNMLFLFPFERSWEFWMFGMGYGLKIIFIDSKKRVIDTQKAEPLSLNPKTWKVYAPKKKCKYVLEVPMESKYKFKEGDILKWQD